MQNNKNNITLSFKNIISFLNNLISYFTERRKIITLCLLILMLSFVNVIFNVTNISALSYESSVGIGFTFNPTLSVSLSSSDLIIPNLTPGSTANSNNINVSVATNASFGYTLSVNASNEDLVHSNNTNIFNGIATDANLENLTTDNTWGYSTSLDNGSSWSNYNGLSSSSSTVLLDNSNTADSTGNIDFRIGAKASSTQASGIYTNTINFIAVSKVAPISLLDSFIASGAEQYNGYFKMQDMTHDICESVDIEESELQLIDIRDNKIYWVAKLKDGNCWMTQNLDLELDSTRTYTHWDTDLGWSTENGNSVDESATWQPERSTINFTIGSAIPSWQDNTTEPYSANPGDVYFYTSNSDTDDIQYNSLQECFNAKHNDCIHYHIGNYYNWSAAVASNDTSELVDNYGNAPNSICPRGWKLPNRTNSNNELIDLLFSQKIIQNKTSSPYTYNQNGFNAIRIAPLYFTRAGNIINHNLSGPKLTGYYWTSAARTTNALAFYLILSPNDISFVSNYGRTYGRSIRCLAR